MAASVRNEWIGYLDRSYQQIKTSVLGRLTNSNPEMTDHSESNPFIILLSIFAGIAEMLGYYIDNVAQEAFFATAERTSSVIKHTRILDYRIKARSPETVDIVITWSEPAPAEFTIAAGSSIESDDGNIPFIMLQDYVVEQGEETSVISFSQVTEVTNANFALSTGAKNQKISLGTNYVHKSLVLTIGGQEFEEQDTFAFSGPSDNHYIVEIEEDGNAYIILGDGVNGRLLTSGLTVAVTFFNTLGPDGKVAGAGFDSQSLVLDATLPGDLDVDNANSLINSAGGSFYEGIEDIRKNAPLFVRTLERMVSLKDYSDILQLMPGIAKAKATFCCGKTIDIYIVPSGGGIPSSQLLALAQAECEEKKMATTFPVVKPAGETVLVIAATVTAKRRKSLTDTTQQVLNALLEFGLVDNQEINGAVRLSDLQALIDNLSNVDFVDITTVYTKPYARPVSHNNPLIWSNLTNANSTSKVRWRVEYDGSNFRVFKNSEFQGSIAQGSEFNDSANSGFRFTIQAGSYELGNMWTFTTYPFMQNLQLDDFTIFKTSEAFITLNVVSAPVVDNNVC